MLTRSLSYQQSYAELDPRERIERERAARRLLAYQEFADSEIARIMTSLLLESDEPTEIETSIGLVHLTEAEKLVL